MHDQGQFALHPQAGGPPCALPPEAIVGREEGCDVHLDDHRISRRHALLKTVGDKIWLEDLGSTNGTYLNGVRLIKGSYAKAGDEIRFDTRTFHLQGSGFDANKTMIRPVLKTTEPSPAPQPARQLPHRERPSSPDKRHAPPTTEENDTSVPTWAYAAGGFVATVLVLGIVLWLSR